MGSLLLVAAALSAGFVLGRLGAFGSRAAARLHTFVIYVSLPALMLIGLHSLALDFAAIIPISMAWLYFALSAGFFIRLGYREEWSSSLIGCLVVVCGLGNTSFVGFPLLLALIGSDAMPTAILVDQPGTFLAVSTIGVWTAARFSGRQGRSGLLGMLRFPPFIALIASLALRSMVFAPWMIHVLRALGATLAPCALMSVGTRIGLGGFAPGRYARPLVLGLLFKLVLSPIAVGLIYVGLLGLRGVPGRVIVLEAAMAPMITGAAVAAQYELEPELSDLLLAYGIPLSLVTVPLWSALLEAWI